MGFGGGEVDDFFNEDGVVFQENVAREMTDRDQVIFELGDGKDLDRGGAVRDLELFSVSTAGKATGCRLQCGLVSLGVGEGSGVSHEGRSHSTIYNTPRRGVQSKWGQAVYCGVGGDRL